MDFNAEAAYQLLLLADARQSHYAAVTPGYRERNPWVRKVGVNTYFITSSVSHLLVSANLPKKYQPLWQYGTIAIQAGFVGRNAYLGAKIRF